MQKLTSYVAQVVNVAPALRQTYAAFLKEQYLPLWVELWQRGLLVGRHTFETVLVYSEAAQLSRWSHLHLMCAAEEVDPQQLLQAEEEQKQTRWATLPTVAQLDQALAEVRRIEVLHSTPYAYYPHPVLAARQREGEVLFSVEYIDVQAARLDEYRHSMMVNSGPAMQLLMQRGTTYNFIALETAEVLLTQPEMPGWNQIHVMGVFSSKTIPDFLRAFYTALREVNPTSGGYQQVFGRLDEYRSKPHWCFTRELTDLRIPE